MGFSLYERDCSGQAKWRESIGMLSASNKSYKIKLCNNAIFSEICIC